ncbi:MAG TPA: DMT family transporter, partial [Burkholderiaceae bacterium]|nr:DMT family transporter [Burkholderiaceae bacterium]
RMTVPEFGVLPLNFVRCALGALALAVLLALQQRRLAREDAALAAGLGLIGNALPFVLFAWATSILPASYPAVINATVPVFGAVLAIWLLRERLTLRRGAGVVLGVTGVALLVGLGPVAMNGPVASAVAAGLGACLCFALSQLLTKRHASHVNALVLTFGMLAAASLVLLLPALLTLPAKWPSAAAWFWVTILAVSNSAWATARYLALVVRIGPVKAMTVPMLIPVFGLLWSAALLGERITPIFVMGTAVILSAVWLVALERRAPAA